MIIPDNIVEQGISLKDQYFDLEGLAAYSAYSVSCLRKYLKQGLPHYKHGKIFIKRSEFDVWIRQFRIEEHELNKIVDGVLSDLKEQ